MSDPTCAIASCGVMDVVAESVGTYRPLACAVSCLGLGALSESVWESRRGGCRGISPGVGVIGCCVPFAWCLSG